METPDESAARIEELIPEDTASWGIVRCDGTLEELASYRSGAGDAGWDVRAECTVGDLLIGTVGQGLSRVIINVNRVEGIFPGGIEWLDESDVPIVPSLGWTEVSTRVGRATVWQRQEGRNAKRFIDALMAELREKTDVPEEEGEVRLSRCRTRSAKNRVRKLDQADGVCEGCSQDFRVGFGVRGDRALEVHHREPLSKTGPGTHTRLSDLAVLCATCHRLVHADPGLRVDGLMPGWNRIWNESWN